MSSYAAPAGSPVRARAKNMLSTRIRARAWPGAASQIRTVPSLPPVVSRWLFGEICQRPTGRHTPAMAPMARL
jgi:hypothetical protein